MFIYILFIVVTCCFQFFFAFPSLFGQRVNLKLLTSVDMIHRLGSLQACYRSCTSSLLVSMHTIEY